MVTYVIELVESKSKGRFDPETIWSDNQGLRLPWKVSTALPLPSSVINYVQFSSYFLLLFVVFAI